jgi:hypothetical protein
MHPIEMAFKRIKMPGPVLAERRQPGVDLEQGLRLEPVDPALGVHGGFDEAGVLENAAGAWRRPAGAAGAGRSISPTDCSVESRRVRMALRLGSARIGERQTPWLLICPSWYIPVKAY